MTAPITRTQSEIRNQTYVKFPTCSANHLTQIHVKITIFYKAYVATIETINWRVSSSFLRSKKYSGCIVICNDRLSLFSRNDSETREKWHADTQHIERILRADKWPSTNLITVMVMIVDILQYLGSGSKRFRLIIILIS